MKAMSFEAHDRYATVREFKQDLERYLADEPVGARRESITEKSLRAIRQRSWLVPAIIVGFIGIWMLQFVARRAQKQLTLAAEAKERVLNQAFELTGEAIKVIDPFASTDENVERLEKHAEKTSQRDVPEMAKARVFDALVDVFQRFQRPESATKWAKESLRISSEQLGKGASETLVRKRDFAKTLRIDGQPEQALAALTEVRGSLEQPGMRFGSLERFYFSILNDIAAINVELGNVDTAIPLQKEVLEYREESLTPDEPEVIIARYNLAQSLNKARRCNEAVKIFAEVEAVVDTQTFPQAEDRLALLLGKYESFFYQKKFEAALAGFQQLHDKYVGLLKSDHRDIVELRHSIAVAKQYLRRFDEAVDDYKAVIASREEVYGDSSPKLWVGHLDLASTLLAAGQPEAAITESEPWLQNLIDKTNFGIAYCHLGSRTMAYALLQLERYDEAAEVINRWETAGDSPAYNFSRELAAGELALHQDNLGLVEDYLEKAVLTLEADESSQPSDHAGVYSLRGALYLRRGKADLAKAELTRAKELLASDPDSLRMYQINWPDTVERRLDELAKQAASN
jgi:hypothetical protein